MKALLPANCEWLWSLQIILQVIALFCGVRRRLWIDYPAVFSYLAFCGVRSLVLKWIAVSATTNTLYSYVFWRASICEDVLLIFVLSELARPLFAPWSIIPVDPKHWFYWSVGLLTGVSVALPFCFKSSLRTLSYDWYLQAIARTLIRSTSLVIAGVMLLGCMMAWYHSIPWERKARALTAGLVVKYGVEAWFWFAVLSADRLTTTRLQWIRISAAIAASIFFVTAVLMPEKPTLNLSEGHLAALRRFGRVNLRVPLCGVRSGKD